MTQTVLLGDEIELIGGGTPKTSIPEYWNGLVPWLSVADFGNDRRWVCSTEKSITEAGLKNSSAKLLDTGDIIISARGTVGEIAQLRLPMAFNQSCYGIRAGKNLNQDYLYYLLKYSIADLQRQAHGGVFSTITRETFQHIKAELPLLEIQKNIAEILGSFDEKIELNRRMNETLEQMGQALFKHYFIDNPAAKTWSTDTIGNKCEVLLGGTPSRTKSEYWKGGTIGWINSGKVNEFRIVSPTEMITEEALKKSATKVLPTGTTVLAITGATLGQVSRLEQPFAANQSVIGIVGDDEITNEFIYFYINENIEKIIGHQTGGAQQHINRNNIVNFDLIIPPPIQLNGFQLIIEPVMHQISNNCLEIENLTHLRDLLLPRLISGKIRV